MEKYTELNNLIDRANLIEDYYEENSHRLTKKNKLYIKQISSSISKEFYNTKRKNRETLCKCNDIAIKLFNLTK